MKKVRNAQSYYQMYLNKSLDACSNDITLVFKRILVTIDIWQIFFIQLAFRQPISCTGRFQKPLQTSKGFSGVFMGYRKRPAA